MFNVDDIIELESGDLSADKRAELMQKAINDGTAWSFQGSYGRSMMAAIESGECMLGTRAAKNAYGGRIPSRFEVQEGTKGSRAYVVERHGEDWAQMLEAMDTAPTAKPPKP